MIVAGIDEAGYGPVLGPLVVGCSAFEVTDADTPAAGKLPCLWSRLRKVVSKNRSKSGRKLHVNDSKLVYSPGIGLKELERSVLAVAAAWRESSERFEDFISQVAGHVLSDLDQSTWYRRVNGESFPFAQAATPVRLFASALRQEMQRGGARCVYLGARVVLER